MKPLRSLLDRLEPLFTKGGRFEQLHALYEAVDTFFYSPPDLARGSPHVRTTSCVATSRMTSAPASDMCMNQRPSSVNATGDVT